jgi:hypothetical protein
MKIRYSNNPQRRCIAMAMGAMDVVQTRGGIKTTMINTHVLNRGPSGVRSPVDGL